MLLLIFAANLSMWFPRYPHLFPASKANPIIFPFAVPIGAAFAHWHPGHLFTAIWAKVSNASCVCTLPTTVSCKWHPHPAACTLRRVILPHFPFGHLPSTYLHHIAPALRRPCYHSRYPAIYVINTCDAFIAALSARIALQ